MSVTEVKELENLIQPAMGNAVIRDSYRGSPMATGEYLMLLASHRQPFDPDQCSFAKRFQPEIRDNSVRERLTLTTWLLRLPWLSKVGDGSERNVITTRATKAALSPPRR